MHDETTIEAVRWRAVRELEKARDAAEETLRYAQWGHERAEELAERAEGAIRARNREEVAEWARGVLEDPKTVILSLGTTGLEDPVDIVEAIVLDMAGETVFSERIRPAGYVVTETLDGDGIEVKHDPVEISTGAAVMHGHTLETLADASTFSAVWPDLLRALCRRRVIVYNADYLCRVLPQTIDRYDSEPLDGVQLSCAMEQYARIEGQWSLEDETYRPVPLPGRDGTPEGNARALYQLLRTLAERVPVSTVSGGRRKDEVDLNEEDFDDVPFRALFPARVRYPLI